MILVTGFYADPDEGRAGELRECLRRNIENRAIDELWVFVEDGTPPAEIMAAAGVAEDDRGKVHFVEHGRRVTFDDLFGFAAGRPAPQRYVIANADIAFDATLGLLDGVGLPNQLLCLSRWDERDDGSIVFFDHPDSQDAWIFDTPLARFSAAFHLGLPGCDNRLAWEAGRAGIELANPGRSIRARHVHRSGVHRYTERKRLAGPTRTVPASRAGDRGPQPPGGHPGLAAMLRRRGRWG